ANSSIKSLAREGFSQFMPPYRTITSNEEPKFLLDQDVYAITARFLIDAGHDVVLVAQHRPT
ncbi:MAG: hypothetical protein O9326_00925, partial [Microcystis sp. LE19-338.1B]|nr:hypothetical protein [Microcystis sp. LE19-338.1B]